MAELSFYADFKIGMQDKFVRICLVPSTVLGGMCQGGVLIVREPPFQENKTLIFTR